jgi:hypothetical protein
MQRKTLMSLVAGIVGLAVVATALGVYAQPGPPAAGGPGGPAGGRNFGQMMGMMRMASGTAIAVNDGAVYVVYMGTLFRFNADTLEEEAQVQLRPQGMPGMGMGQPGGAPAAAPGQ